MDYVSPFDERRRAAEPLAARRKPLREASIALLDINKRRGDEFLDRVEDRLRRLPMGDRKGRAFARAFLLDACRVSVDAQGRIPIPPALMNRAGLGKEAVLLGQVDRIEIWHPERLDAAVHEARQSMESLADEVLGERNP
jgi:MraZ protein